MNKLVLVSVLCAALLVAFGSIIFYYSQEYEFSLELKDTVNSDDIYLLTQNESYWNGTIQIFTNNIISITGFSVLLGSMNFENKGVLDRVVEVPRYFVCFDLTETAANTQGSGNFLGPFGVYYTLTEPVFEQESGSGVVQIYEAYEQIYKTSSQPSEIYTQYYNRNNNLIEVSSDSELKYYISLKNVYSVIPRSGSDSLKNGKFLVYEVPLKEDNPLSEGYNYGNSFSDCQNNNEYPPVKTINVV